MTTDVQSDNPSPAALRPRKVVIETWGCQMNTADSERMLALLEDRNYVLSHDPADADLVLLNTCHIREKARHKVLSRLGILKDLKAKNPDMRIAVTGCVAQAEGSRLLKSAPQIDVLLGPGKIDELPRLLDEQRANGGNAMAIGFKRPEPHAEQPEAKAIVDAKAAPTLTGKIDVSRYVNIQQGCDNYCTFCVVPFTRGREISRTEDEVDAECAALVANGAREITLLGQNVNSYGMDLVESGKRAPTATGPFVDLLDRVAQMDGLERLRFTTSNPHDFSEALAQLFAKRPKLGRYIHLPVQSGSDRTLLRMKRKVTVAEYWQRIHWLRAAVPDMAFSTDLIVGFPGETEEEFEETLKLVEAVRFSFAFTFKYSPRKNTPAARYTDQVPEDVKESRLARLNALQDRITIEQNMAEIGQTRAVLFHYESPKHPGQFYGRTEHFRLVRVAASRNLVGQVLPVHITEANKTALIGHLS